MAAPRKTRRTPSTTSSRSSETQTESPLNDSQESTNLSDETSTPETDEKDSSSSTLSEEDANDALFADADAQASGGSESDDDELDDDEDADDENVDPEVTQARQDGFEATTDTGTVVNEYGVVAVGDVHEFHVKDDRGDYSFRGHVQHNIIIVSESAWREVPLGGTSRTTKLLAHHKGQTLPLAIYKEFSDSLNDQED